MTVVSVTPSAPTGIAVSKAGPRGKGWIFGNGAPIDSVGADGDQYYDRVTGIAYGPKAAGTWVGAPTLNLRADAAAAEAATLLTAADAVATAADRVQTGLDRVATGNDKTAAAVSATTAVNNAVQTGLDVTATAADRVQTGLDRVATGNDKTATAADRVQTGLDRVATGNDKTATAADRVQTGLDRVATGNDKTATAADRVQTGLDATATAADRVQTGLDRAAAAASAASITPVAQQIASATAKTTPIDADSLGIVDSAASNALKKLTFGNLRTWIRAQLDSVYQAAGSYAAAVHTHTVSQLSDASANARSFLQAANYAAMFTAVKQAATTAATGVVALATNTEAQTGTDTAKAVTPAALASRTATDARTGLVELATDAEMTAGTATTVVPVVKQVADFVTANPAPPKTVSALKTDVYTMASGLAGTWQDIPGLSVTITPSDVSRKIKLDGFVTAGVAGSSAYASLRLLRNGTPIAIGDPPASGSRRQVTNGFNPPGSTSSISEANFSVIDSPATTSAVTYSVQFNITTGSSQINRSSNDSSSGDTRSVSSLIAMEVQ